MSSLTVDTTSITVDDSFITVDETSLGADVTSALNPLGIGTVAGDETGDEPRAGFTKIKADHSTLLFTITRRQTLAGTFGVTSSTGSGTLLNDTTQAWTANQFAGQTLTILSGGLAGYSGVIASNTATSVTLWWRCRAHITSAMAAQISPSITNAGSDGFATTAGGTASFNARRCESGVDHE